MDREPTTLDNLHGLSSRGILHIVRTHTSMNPGRYPLLQKIVDQYLYNTKHFGAGKRGIAFNAFPPFTFYHNRELRLSMAMRIKFAAYLDRDLVGQARQEYNINVLQGSVKKVATGVDMQVTINIIKLVAKAEFRENRGL